MSNKDSPIGFLTYVLHDFNKYDLIVAHKGVSFQKTLPIACFLIRRLYVISCFLIITLCTILWRCKTQSAKKNRTSSSNTVTAFFLLLCSWIILCFIFEHGSSRLVALSLNLYSVNYHCNILWVWSCEVLCLLSICGL